MHQVKLLKNVYMQTQTYKEQASKKNIEEVKTNES